MFPGGAAGDGHDTAGAGVGAVTDGAAETGCAGVLSPLPGHDTSGLFGAAKLGSVTVTVVPRLRNHADSNSRKIGNSIVSSRNAVILAGSG
jgi:hypothetical protein